MAGIVQYRNARIDNSENTVDIKKVFEEHRKDYTYRSKHYFNCPCCGKGMMAVLGKNREKHFRHKGTPCGYNNYLHSTAEQVFFEEYNRCLNNRVQFIISVFPEILCNPSCVRINQASCPKKNKGKTVINLTSIYKKISPEKIVYLDGRFRRPDLLLESETGEKLWVEIWVSHKTDEAKRKQGRILEIKIASEDDLERIRTHKLTQIEPQDKSIKYFDCLDICLEPELPREEETSEKKFKESGSISWPSITPSRIGNHIPTPASLNSRKRLNPPAVLTLPQDLALLKELPSRSNTHYWKRKQEPEWVNLSLPSGTLWSKEYMGSMSFEEAQCEFSHLIPSPEQYIELASSCKTTGPIPSGFIGPIGGLLQMNDGDFWVNLSLNTNQALVFHREFCSDYGPKKKVPFLEGLGFVKADKRMRLCVRLAKKRNQD